MGEVVYAAPQFGQHPARSQRVITTVARVLIVDADPAALAAISQALQSEGHHTATAFDATAAIAVAERLGPFELLITDLRMTPIDGLELAATLRRRESALQVIYLTSAHDELFSRTVPLTADDDVLEKPFSEEELMQTVRRIL
jgi:CheY-like chemotaxis protein